MSENDLRELRDQYGITEDDFRKTALKIERNEKLRPFERTEPFFRKLLFWLLGFIIILVYLYAAFFIL